MNRFIFVILPTTFGLILSYSAALQNENSFNLHQNSNQKETGKNSTSTEDQNNIITTCYFRCNCSQNMISCKNLGLSNLPFEKLTQTQLKTVDFSGNNIKELTVGIFSNVKNVENVIFSGNQLRNIKPDDIPHTIVKLHINGNRFGGIPVEALKRKRSLKYVNLNSNFIKVIPENSFEDQTSLRVLDLSNNEISKISQFAFNGLKKLEILDLAYNNLSTVGDIHVFEELSSLIILELNGNRLTSVPASISKLKNLKKLSLANNRIESIPYGIFQNCKSLNQLELNGNQFQQIDVNAFSSLPKLRQLIISDARNVQNFPNLNGTFSLEQFRFDRSGISSLDGPRFCQNCPLIRSLELKSNKITELPDLQLCQNLRLLDLRSNRITRLWIGPSKSPFSTMNQLQDLMLNKNLIRSIHNETFQGLRRLEILDISDNDISEIEEAAFLPLTGLKDINLGDNTFSKLPSLGLETVIHLKSHNNLELKDFPGPERFPLVETLVLSYAYHCCSFKQNVHFEGRDKVKEDTALPEVFLPGEIDLSTYNMNDSIIWIDLDNVSRSYENMTKNIQKTFGVDMLANFEGFRHKRVKNIQCVPVPGPFLPCNDLFDWWSLRCSIWIIFLTALLGNGCVVIVLIASRNKMDVPRFLVCNLALADFCMGIYLGFLAVLDASTLGEFRKYGLEWQFSTGCQVAGFMGVLSSEMSVFILAVITMERNYAITHAMHLNKRLSLKHAAYIMTFAWSFGLLLAAFPLFGISDYRKFAVCLPFETSNGQSLGYVIFILLINGVAFSILMGCYLKMYCAIRGSQAWNSNDSRIAKRMALLVFTDFLCWAPIAFFGITSSLGLHLINLEQAKVFTVFILPLNSCFNPFLYAIMTKQFKKDCVTICKSIEESRVTRGIGRCRHSSNFSNRQTPANTNSVNSGSGGSNGTCNSRQTVCSCNIKKGDISRRIMHYWPFNRLRSLLMGYKNADQDGPRISSAYAHQIAEIQHKSKRYTSLSSDNFSSSRSESMRNTLEEQCGMTRKNFKLTGRGRNLLLHHHRHHRRRNSWTVIRKPSQDSQLSSSRNDSACSNSTNTWRMSRSSVSSDMGHLLKSSGSNFQLADGKIVGTYTKVPHRTSSGKFRLLQKSISRQDSNYNADLEEGSKPKLTRQTAILDDGTSTGSAKSVTFKDLPVLPKHPHDDCPVHSAEDRLRLLYEKLAETSQDPESDMEPSDEDDDQDYDDDIDMLPLGTTFRIMAADKAPPRTYHPSRLTVGFVPHKLSTITSRGSLNKIDADSPDGSVFQHQAEISHSCESISHRNEISYKEASVGVPSNPPTAKLQIHSPQRKQSLILETPSDFSNTVENIVDSSKYKTHKNDDNNESDVNIKDVNVRESENFETEVLIPKITFNKQNHRIAYRNTQL